MYSGVCRKPQCPPPSDKRLKSGCFFILKECLHLTLPTTARLQFRQSIHFFFDALK